MFFFILYNQVRIIEMGTWFSCQRQAAAKTKPNKKKCRVSRELLALGAVRNGKRQSSYAQVLKRQAVWERSELGVLMDAVVGSPPRRFPMEAGTVEEKP